MSHNLLIFKALAAVHAAGDWADSVAHRMAIDPLDAALALAVAADRGFLTRSTPREVTPEGFAWAAETLGPAGLAFAAELADAELDAPAQPSPEGGLPAGRVAA